MGEMAMFFLPVLLKLLLIAELEATLTPALVNARHNDNNNIICHQRHTISAALAAPTADCEMHDLLTRFSIRLLKGVGRRLLEKNVVIEWFLRGRELVRNACNMDIFNGACIASNRRHFVSRHLFIRPAANYCMSLVRLQPADAPLDTALAFNYHIWSTKVYSQRLKPGVNDV